jgi:hypothetical protein
MKKGIISSIDYKSKPLSFIICPENTKVFCNYKLNIRNEDIIICELEIVKGAKGEKDVNYIYTYPFISIKSCLSSFTVIYKNVFYERKTFLQYSNPFDKKIKPFEFNRSFSFYKNCSYTFDKKTFFKITKESFNYISMNFPNLNEIIDIYNLIIENFQQNGETPEEIFSQLNHIYFNELEYLNFEDIFIDSDFTKRFMKKWLIQVENRRFELLGIQKKDFQYMENKTIHFYKKILSNLLYFPYIPIENINAWKKIECLSYSIEEYIYGREIRNFFHSLINNRICSFNKKQIENSEIIDSINLDYIKNYQFNDNLFYQLDFVYRMENQVCDFIVSKMINNKIDPNISLENREIKFTPFNKELSEQQKLSIQNVLDQNVSIITGGPGVGKCFGFNTEIIMFNGQVEKIQNVKKDDYIMGEDSKPRKVIETCMGYDTLYTILPEYGNSFTCTSNHILTLCGVSTKIIKNKIYFSTYGNSKMRFIKNKKDINCMKTYKDVFDISLSDYIHLPNYIRNNCFLFHRKVNYVYKEYKLFYIYLKFFNEFIKYELEPSVAQLNKFNLKSMRIPPEILYNHKNYRKRILSNILSIQKNCIDTTLEMAIDIETLANSLGKVVQRIDNKVRIYNRSYKKFTISNFKRDLFYGFELSGNGRFLLKDCLVVHNSSCIKEIVLQLENLSKNYFCCSFTGKAVSRIKILTNSENCFTIHTLIKKRLIEIKQNSIQKKINSIIIDEASMVTSKLFLNLVNFYPEVNQFIFIGDPNQLQPIEYGNLFSQLIFSKTIPIFKLVENFRVNKNEIEDEGIIKNSNEILINKNYKFIKSANTKFYKGGINKIVELLTKFKSFDIDPKDIMLLCPFNKEVEILNIEFQKIFNSEEKDFIMKKCKNNKNLEYKWKVDDRVILLKNNSKHKIFNGDIGTIFSIDKININVDFENEKIVKFPIIEKNSNINDEDEDEENEETNSEQLSLSYSITIHKSQGSEFNYVILYIPKFIRGFTEKSLLYTAITRSARLFILVCDSIHEFETHSKEKIKNTNDLLSYKLQQKLPKLKVFENEDLDDNSMKMDCLLNPEFDDDYEIQYNDMIEDDEIYD